MSKMHAKDQKGHRRRRSRIFDLCFLIFAVSQRDKGSVYLHVLASSLLVSVIGLGSLFAVRVQMRSCRLGKDYAEARTCAVSAVELGIQHIKQDSAWRTTWPNGFWMEDKPLGAGRFALKGTDPQDSDLANSPYDAIVLTGIGTRGQARHITQVVLVPVIKPIEALTSCLQGSGSLKINSGKRITAVGAPVCTNGQLDNDGTIDGTAQAQSIADTGTITGGPPLVPGPVKRMPDADVISRYVTRAHSVTYASTREKFVLAPGYNPYGTADPNGLYLINTNNGSLTIKDCRIYGTLVVQAGTGTVTLDSSVFLQNYRSDFPSLLVTASTVIIRCTSATTQLSESSLNTNFNPAAAPYQGVSDTDKVDSYPNEIRGLVHIEGSLRLQQTARIVGVVICNGSVTCEETNTITYNSSLYACPPRWYTYVDGMKLSPGSWKQVVE
jgi:hypothetical protein